MNEIHKIEDLKETVQHDIKMLTKSLTDIKNDIVENELYNMNEVVRWKGDDIVINCTILRQLRVFEHWLIEKEGEIKVGDVELVLQERIDTLQQEINRMNSWNSTGVFHNAYSHYTIVAYTRMIYDSPLGGRYFRAYLKRLTNNNEKS